METLVQILSKFKSSERKLGNEPGALSEKDFYYRLIIAISQVPRGAKIVLVEEDPIHFMILLCALYNQNSKIILVANREIANELASKEKILILDRDSIDWSAKAPDRELVFGQSTALIDFYTSGSTGKPKVVSKSLDMVLNEVQNLLALWAGHYQNTLVRTSLSHFHYYGFLFTAFVPLFSGGIFAAQKVMYPEQILDLQTGPWLFVSSPAFYKRCSAQVSLPSTYKAATVSFSSGGFLPEDVAEAFSESYRTPVIEIYGSTETGGIAYKISPHFPWSFFEGVSHRISHEGTLVVASPYFDQGVEIDTNDLVEIGPESSFQLIGRNDSIVKVEEKRISTQYLEGLINDTGLVKESRVMLDTSDRQKLVAFIVLSDQALSISNFNNKKELIAEIKARLSTKVDPIVIPKKWRFVSKFEQSALGKILAEPLLRLLDAETYAGKNPIIFSKLEIDQKLEIVLEFDQSYKYFRGHFDDFQILPAVAQVDLVMQIARREFGTRLYTTQIPRIKFQSPIRPSSLVSLTISHSPEAISFEFKKLRSGKPCSSGKIKIGELND